MFRVAVFNLTLAAGVCNGMWKEKSAVALCNPDKVDTSVAPYTSTYGLSYLGVTYPVVHSIVSNAIHSTSEGGSMRDIKAANNILKMSPVGRFFTIMPTVFFVNGSIFCAGHHLGRLAWRAF